MCLLNDSVKGCKQGRSELFSGLTGLGISGSGAALGAAPYGWVQAGAGHLQFGADGALLGFTCSARQGGYWAGGETGQETTSHRRVDFHPLKNSSLNKNLNDLLKRAPPASSERGTRWIHI